MASTGSNSSVVTSRAESAQVDIVVGLTSYNDAATVDSIAAALRDGVVGQFVGASSRFVIADCGSTDDTATRIRDLLSGMGEVVEVASAPTTTDLLELPYHRIPGKARALHGILTTAKSLGARACIVLDTGIDTVTPQWLQWLTSPVLTDGFDLVAPFYRRHPYEGALTKGIVYPMFRALYGVRLRQPAAGEFACSSRLLGRFLEEDLWDRDGSQVGIDLWLTSSAVSGDFRIGEAALGIRHQHAHPDETIDLGTTVTQVVGALFADLENRVERWQRVRGSVSVQQFGKLATGAALQSISIDHERLIESYRLGYQELRDIWTSILPPRSILDLRRLMDRPATSFRLDDGLWARIIYDFALGYRLRVLAREHILRSLVPLYLAWLASFIIEVRDRGEDEVEQRLEGLCAAFEAQKPYLISKWRWPERLRT
jgi:glucosylglycerate synthase